jgi:hypothetical protein
MKRVSAAAVKTGVQMESEEGTTFPSGQGSDRIRRLSWYLGSCWTLSNGAKRVEFQWGCNGASLNNEPGESEVGEIYGRKL